MVSIILVSRMSSLRCDDDSGVDVVAAADLAALLQQQRQHGVVKCCEMFLNVPKCS
jgi:hypothetical protein